MSVPFRRALRAAVLSIALVAGLASGAQAAKPVKPGVPTDLKIVSITASGGSYLVTTTWTAGANTTSFFATVTSGTTILASAALTSPSWAPLVSAPAGTVITVNVQGVYDGRKGTAASASGTLPDVAAPVGVYEATWGAPADGKVRVTFKQTSLTDNVSAPAAVQVAVDFGDGSPVKQTNGGETTFVYDYAVVKVDGDRYQPQIRLTDAAGNVSYAAVNAVVVNDTVAPTGTTSLTRTTGWTGWTAVGLTATATDNLSPADKIRRTVSWGDGSTSTDHGTGPLSHVYKTRGTYRPTVVFTDEARPSNTSAAVEAGAVTIENDVAKPTLSLTLPRTRLRSVRSWKVLRGTAADAQTAVRSVRLKVVQKRSGVFFAYVPAKRTWLKVGTKAKAFAKAGVLAVPPSATGAWSASLTGLGIGVLVYQVAAVDVMGNATAPIVRKQRLVKR